MSEINSLRTLILLNPEGNLSVGLTFPSRLFVHLMRTLVNHTRPTSRRGSNLNLDHSLATNHPRRNDFEVE